MSVTEALQDWIAGLLESEGITPQILETVDLEVEYSPVIPFRGGRYEHAVPVRPWGFPPDGVLPDRFEVQHPLVTSPVDRDTLRIMRARYLLARDAHFGAIVRRWLTDLGTAGGDTSRQEEAKS